MVSLAPSDARASVIDRFVAIRRYARHGFVAPNKSLTLLWALDRLERGEPRLAPFAEAEEELRPLLDAYGTPGTSAGYAFWRLQNDGLWEVVSSVGLPMRSDRKEPRIATLREHARGGFEKAVHSRLTADSILRSEVAALLGNDLLGHDAPLAQAPPRAFRSSRETVRRLIRQAAFKHGVMTAYRSRCVVCGWSFVHRGRPIGLAAAHVRPLSQGGPDQHGNGMPLCNLHQDLFDAGLFTYDAQRRLVPARSLKQGVNGDLLPLADRSGSPLPEPIDKTWRVRDSHLAWHRRHVFAR